MPYNPAIHHRRSIRLKGYDYSQAGLYFITICTQNRACLFGEIVGANPCGRPDFGRPEMILNDAGRMVEKEWLKLPERFINIALHEYIVMPNHFHAILEIVGATLVVAHNDEDGQPQGLPQREIPQRETPQRETPQREGETVSTRVKTLGGMIGAFQSITTVEYIRGVKNNNWQPFDRILWQRNYYEHIIRNEVSYVRISDYIINNPSNRDNDSFSRTGFIHV